MRTKPLNNLRDDERDYVKVLQNHSLRVTPQRVAVLEALHLLRNHPSTDEIIQYIHKKHPGVATGTVYKVIDTFFEKDIIQRVKSDKGVMRYEWEYENHHHLHCCHDASVSDYFDERLDGLLHRYFKKNPIPGFDISTIKLDITGTYNNNINQSV